MSNLIYRYRGKNLREFRGSYQEVVNNEFYTGDLDVVLPFGTRIAAYDLSLVQALKQPISLLQIRANVAIEFRRSLIHIRNDKCDARVVWFVRRGTFKIVRSQNSCVIRENEFAILDSSEPFFVHVEPDAAGIFETLQTIIPAQLFFSHLVGADKLDCAFPVDYHNRRLLAKLLELMLDEGALVTDKAAEPLVTTFLETLADSIHDKLTENRGPRSLTQKRMSDIQAYILKELTNPDLCYPMVARECNISTRYLSYVLSAHDLTFSSILWGKRIEKTSEWLRSPDFDNYPIAEIAYMAGFKSAAHFSRMFKKVHNCTPSQFRFRNQDHVPTDSIQ